jgi:hypothetical protein
VIRANTLPEDVWRKSSYSGSESNTCVEVVDGLPVVPVRDSKVKDGAAIVFTPGVWSEFVSTL